MVESVCILLNVVKKHGNKSLSKYLHQLEIINSMFYCQIFGILHMIKHSRGKFCSTYIKLKKVKNLVGKAFTVVKIFLHSKFVLVD